MPCPKRIKELQGEESKERDVEDGWVETDAPANSKAGQLTAEIPDIDMDMENVEDNQAEQEAVSKKSPEKSLILERHFQE